MHSTKKQIPERDTHGKLSVLIFKYLDLGWNCMLLQ